MNSSAVSVYDNVDTPKKLSKSGIYRKLSDLLKVNTDFEQRIFCPLCVRSFSFKFPLFEHLKTFHENFLIQVNNQYITFKECPFCSAKFYGKHLIAKHVLYYHSKVIRALFANKNKLKCFFCNIKLNKGNYDSFIKHFEESHFLNFEEEFIKIFPCDITQEMSVSELINSTLANWEDICLKTEKHSRNDPDFKNCDEASRINFYDFRDLKQQLENIMDIKDERNSDLNPANKSVLKDSKNFDLPQRSARRVLRFDLPSNSRDKENSGLENNFSTLKKLNLDEFSFICEGNKPDVIFKLDGTFCEKPQHSSTPNSVFIGISKNKIKKQYTAYPKSNFKSLSERQINKFDFQCGKCRMLFKKNLDLVYHVKNSHKMFSLNAFQPHYHCAICNARFYKNHYLRKHHNLHKPY